MQHSFNFPFQIGTGSEFISNKAFYNAHELKKGDILIFGSDGLFDNLYNQDVERISQSATADNKDLREFGQSLLQTT
eukprot:CAMPEP_0116898790 /NCGR_PEP_ID=MMETSP0467-20121206/7462_1 /TAXON_ID=283647 /ORGANISM="Mesodinium pulex, Strain SPMC105" /LENGTH=76 /DNA_ID=CAMNT_0004571169 /DNA_START=498 /DNA_END=728 /DNA_ORIENTATION=+